MIRGPRLVFPAAILLALLALCLPKSASPAPPEKEASPPAPGPSTLVERAEVRFVTLDLVVEEHVRGVWRRARNLTADQVRVKVGGRPVELELFENGCGSEGPRVRPDKSAPETTGPAGAPAPAGTHGETSAGPAPSSADSSPKPEFPGSEAGPSPQKYVLYFDLEHLTLGSRSEGFKAALEWAKTEMTTQDEVMIVCAGKGLRVVRPMLPASAHLLEDLEAARKDFEGEDLWATGEESRIDEIKRLWWVSRQGAVALAKSYAEIDRSVSSRVMQNFRDLMALFAGIPGTKNMIFVSETLRMVPGSQYFGNPEALQSGFSTIPRVGVFNDISAQLTDAVEAASDKNVRIYTVYAGGLGPGEDTTNPLVMLASETGGLAVHGTNRLGMVFDRVEEDLACVYRIGFRISMTHTGKILPISVIVGDEGRGYRVRHRRSLTDPTREEQEAEHLLTAFLTPGSAHEFPLTLRAIRLFDGPLGSRARIEVEVPLTGLLSLPAAAGGGRKASVIIGGKVVALRDEPAPRATGTQDPWFGTDPRRATLAFDRRADLGLPSGPGSAGDRRVVYTGEVDLPPGAYRIIAVAEDRQARSASARILDFISRRGDNHLGEVGWMSRDPMVVAIGQAAPDREENRSSPRKQSEARLAAASIPAEMLVSDSATMPAGRSVSFVYAVCDSPPLPAGKDKGPPSEPFQGWRLLREVRCGGATAATFAPRTVPGITEGESCAVIVDPWEGSESGSGDCRFEVRLESPGAPPEVRARDFRIAPPGS